MRASSPESIFDPYEWLPGYGENNVSFYSIGFDVIVEVEYDKECVCGENTMVSKRKLIFKGVRSFIKEPFPGNFLFDGLEIDKIGHFIIFKRSDFLENYDSTCSRLYGKSFQRLNHFYIQFLSENIAIHALAKDYILSDEMQC